MGMDAKPRECTNATNIHLRVQTVQTCMPHSEKKKKSMYAHAHTHTHTNAQQFQTKMFREDSAWGWWVSVSKHSFPKHIW